MARIIVLTSKAKNAELTGQKAKVVSILSKTEKGIEFSQLKTKSRMSPKTLRSRVRELSRMKLVSVRKAA